MDAPHINGDHNKLYEMVGELRGLAKGMDEKLDIFIGEQKGHDGRIRSLETDSAKAKGWAAAIGAISGIIISFVKDWTFGRH